MSYRQRLTIIIGLILLSTAGCAGQEGQREPFSAGATLPPPSKQGSVLGIPWESQFGTKGAVKVRDTLFIAAQLSWDEHVNVTGDTMEAQMRRIYANIAKLLEPYGAKVKDVVEETIFVTDMKNALAAAHRVRPEVFGEMPTVASSILEMSQLADAKAHVAIKAVAKLDLSLGQGAGTPQSNGRSRGGAGRSRGGMSVRSLAVLEAASPAG